MATCTSASGPKHCSVTASPGVDEGSDSSLVCRQSFVRSSWSSKGDWISRVAVPSCQKSSGATGRTVGNRPFEGSGATAPNRITRQAPRSGSGSCSTIRRERGRMGSGMPSSFPAATILSNRISGRLSSSPSLASDQGSWVSPYRAVTRLSGQSRSSGISRIGSCRTSSFSSPESCKPRGEKSYVIAWRTRVRGRPS